MTGDGISLLSAIFGTVHCREVFDCDQDLDSYGGIVLWFALCLYMFKQLGTICDEYFVPSLEVIVEKLEMSPDVAGATFMAAGSSAPELFTSMVATFFIVNEGGIGTIVGSAIFNILVIVGATAICACKENALAIWWYPLTRDCIFYMISITELMLFLSDDEIHWHESAIMLVTYFFYIFYMWLNPRVTEYFGIIDPNHRAKGEADDPFAAVEGPQAESEVAYELAKLQTCEVKRHSLGSGNGHPITHDPVTEVKVCQNSGEVKAPSKTPVRFEVEVDIQELAMDAKECPATGKDPAAGKVVENDLPNTIPDAELASDTGATDYDSKDETDENSDDQERPVHHLRSGTLMSTASAAAKRKEASRIRMSFAGAKNEAHLDKPNFRSVVPGEDEAECPRVPSSEIFAASTTSSKRPSQDVQGSGARSDSDRSMFTKNNQGTLPSEEGEKMVASAWHRLKKSRTWQRLARSRTVRGLDCVWKNLPDPVLLVLDKCMPSPARHHWLLFSLSILCIGLSTYVMVDSVNRAGTILKVPPMVMGLTVLAAGTSIPDALGSIAVAKQGEGDMAVANALGSNIFDILVGLGLPWTIRCAMGRRVHFPNKFETMYADIIILACVLLLFVGSLLLNRWRLTRKVGIVLIGFYFMNVLYNILAVYVLKTKIADND